MKVSELIAKLQKMPQNLDIVVFHEDCENVITDVRHSTWLEDDNTTGRLKRIEAPTVTIYIEESF